MLEGKKTELKHSFKMCAFCWLALLNCITMHGTKNIKNANASDLKGPEN